MHRKIRKESFYFGNPFGFLAGGFILFTMVTLEISTNNKRVPLHQIND